MDAKNLAQRRAWVFTIIAVLIGAVLFLKPFLNTIALAALFAYLFNPIFLRLKNKFHGKSSLAAALTTIISILVIGIPIMIVFAVSVAQAVHLANSLGFDNSSLGTIDFNSEISALVNKANSIINSTLGIENALSVSGITNTIKELGPKLVNFFVELVGGIVTGIPNFVTSSITYLFVFIGILLGQQNILEAVRYLSPFNNDINSRYLKRIGLMCNAMVKGQLLIAFCQGLASALVVCLSLGIMEYFFFFLLLFTFMSLIPLGAGIITIPLGILAVLFGEVWQGLAILLNHFIIVTNIDNFIRPKVVPKEAYLPAALTLLAAFAGVKYFGLVGVVYGPIIMIFITSTIEMYVEYRKTLETKNKPATKPER